MLTLRASWSQQETRPWHTSTNVSVSLRKHASMHGLAAGLTWGPILAREQVKWDSGATAKTRVNERMTCAQLLPLSRR